MTFPTFASLRRGDFALKSDHSACGRAGAPANLSATVTNEEKLRWVFAEAFDLPLAEITDALAYRECAKWDSIAHMALVAAIDAAFQTMLETDDIIDLSSFRKAREILGKYGVSFDS